MSIAKKKKIKYKSFYTINGFQMVLRTKEAYFCTENDMIIKIFYLY